MILYSAEKCSELFVFIRKSDYVLNNLVSVVKKGSAVVSVIISSITNQGSNVTFTNNNEKP